MGIKISNELRLARAEARAEQQNAALPGLQATSAIAFVVMAESGTVDEITASEHMDVFAPWQPEVAYTVGNLRTYGQGEDVKLYKCVQAHTSQADWTPDVSASLWSVAGDPGEEWPEWSQPIGAHDAYDVGDEVTHNGKHYVSTASANVWEPGVYGWQEEGWSHGSLDLDSSVPDHRSAAFGFRAGPVQGRKR